MQYARKSNAFVTDRELGKIPVSIHDGFPTCSSELTVFL